MGVFALCYLASGHSVDAEVVVVLRVLVVPRVQEAVGARGQFARAGEEFEETEFVGPGETEDEQFVGPGEEADGAEPESE